MAHNPRIDRDWRDPWLRSGRSADYAITLARVQWDLFTTPTFKGCVPRPNIAFGLVYRWCRGIAEHSGVPYKNLLLAIRGEYGEKNGRFHLHCLIGGTHTRNNQSLCHWSEWSWKHLTSGARIDCRQYDRSQAGAAYVAKCLNGGNAYELGKYNLADSVTLSLSVFSLIRGLDESGERRGGLHT